MLKKVVRYLVISLLVFLGAVILFVAFSIAPVDRTPPKEQSFYQDMLGRITPQPVSRGGLAVGYAVENLTPDQPTAFAGYVKRRGKKFTSVKDSIYVRAMVIAQDGKRVAIVSADLLIIPPTVTARLKEILPGIGFSLDNTYLGATHTHNSIGHWGRGATGFLYGSYDEAIVTFIADKIRQCIADAAATVQPAEISTGAIPVGQAVYNRLIDNGPVDSLLRLVQITRQDRSKLLLMSYTAHATCLYSADLSLSRDYPGKLVDTMESGGYDFAMFLAGSVGSHGCNPPKYGESCIDWMAEQLSSAIHNHKGALTPLRDSAMVMYRVPLALGAAQVKISEDWRIREWLFRAAFGSDQAFLTALRLGDLILLGTPCDFSGEFNPVLDSTATAHGWHTMVTSFNGGYIGYITPVKYYDVDHYETRIMNWYGPGTGEYMLHCQQKMMEAVGH
ncbi:MAG TPA: neutral/alkaline non-lysosomal ceramidase N-terminal domain-containing protein [Ohtaekwangia sp.]|nr:neutral/alkaline non-lysosomal ceramidase N-terminal domain-containing protein [Ohtaekwangia sp.]